MLELVLTKADLSSLIIVDAETVADSGSNPKKAYTLKNPGLLDAPRHVPNFGGYKCS